MRDIISVDVSPSPRSYWENPFALDDRQYIARRGHLIGPLTLDHKDGYRLNAGCVRPSEIDQVWKVDPATDE
jgi:hypothetical protein